MTAADTQTEYLHDRVHTNDLSSCAYTPLKGVIRWQENEDDWTWLRIGYDRALTTLRALRAARRKRP